MPLRLSQRFKSKRTLLIAAWLSGLVACMPVCGGQPVSMPADAAPEPQSGGTPDQAQRVDVQGDSRDARARLTDPAPRLVIGRSEIERMGESTVVELLSRLPSVTISSSGTPALRGLPGHTQLLVNGERPPPGFQLANLSPDQLERIEIVRGSVAEFSAAAIAGTINLVLREVRQRSTQSLRVDAGGGVGERSTRLHWTRESPANTRGLAYTFSALAVAAQRPRSTAVDALHEDHTGGSTGLLSTREEARFRTQMINGSGRLQWVLSPQQMLTLSPALMLSDVATRADEHQWRTGGLVPGLFDAARTQRSSRLASASLGFNWQRAVVNAGQLELHSQASALQTRVGAQRFESLAGLPQALRAERDRGATRLWRGSATWTDDRLEGHQLKLGLVGNTLVTTDEAWRDLDGQLEALAPGRGAQRLREQSGAVYLQDDWTAGTAWAFNLGLRHEFARSRVRAADASATKRIAIWAPSMSARKKLGADGQDVLRLSLARTYRAPDVEQFTLRPHINPQFPCSANGRCAGNAAEFADQIGNPGLKAQTAIGLDLAFEHQGSHGRFLSVGVFSRLIANQVRQQISLQPVAWAPVPRYVSQPVNIGTARAAGLEMEARFGLREVWPLAPAVAMDTSWSLYRSRASNVAGPDNRLESQPWAHGKLSLQYKAQALPLQVQAAWRWSPATRVRLSEQQSTRLPQQRSLDASAVWTLSPSSSLRLAASNLVPSDEPTIQVFEDAAQRVNTQQRLATHARWSLRWDLKL